MSVNWFDKSISLLCEYFFSLARFACACVSRSNSKDALTWVSLLPFFFLSHTDFLVTASNKTSAHKIVENVFAKNQGQQLEEMSVAPEATLVMLRCPKMTNIVYHFFIIFLLHFKHKNIYIWQTHAVSRIFFLCDESRLPKKITMFSLFDLLHPSQYFVVSILDCLIEMYVNSINRSYVALKVVV